jgi:serine/threonine protein phosphatase PrpC
MGNKPVILDHHFESYNKEKFNAVGDSAAGHREHNNDCYCIYPDLTKKIKLFTGIFDGGCSNNISTILKTKLAQKFKECDNVDDNIIRNICRQVDKEIKTQKTSLLTGSTALFAIITDTELIVCNVGNSKCLVGADKLFLTQSHEPDSDDERTRIEDAQAYVQSKKGYSFVTKFNCDLILNTSRAFGYFELKQDYRNIRSNHIEIHPDNKPIIINPDIYRCELDDMKGNYVTLASDGFWNVYRETKYHRRFTKQLKINKLIDVTCNMVTDAIIRKNSGDNVTLINILFK